MFSRSTVPLFLTALALVRAAFAGDTVNVQFHGAGWIQFGLIEHSTFVPANDLADDLTGNANDFNGNVIQSTGGQITAVARLSDHWEGGLGLGAIQNSNSRGGLNFAYNWNTAWNPFVTEARVTYSQPFGGKNFLQVTVGSFPYDYNPDMRNLGLYLTRGEVYPGAVFSGFETKDILPIATEVGGLVRLKLGDFQNDVLLNSETVTKPYFDFSLLDIASYQATPWLQVGAGVNFYRLLQQNSKVTSPDTGCYSQESPYLGSLPPCYIIDTTSARLVRVDTSLVDPSQANSPSGVVQLTPVLDNVKADTITGSMAGIKLMARFHLDPKLLLGFSGIGGLRFGKEDLVIYGEGAVLGLKDYPIYYNDIWQRMPVMLGFNIPAFGLLDKFALEVEYYGSPSYPDYGNAETDASWIPRRATIQEIDSSRTISYNGYTYNKVEISRMPATTSDNWKWSLYASRALLGHLRIAAQVADDHLIPAAFAGKPVYQTWAEALVTPRDWYWMCKLAYFF